MTVTVSVDNTDLTQTGYGPVLLLAFDRTGPDGVSPGSPAVNAYDGVSLAGSGAVSYLGTALSYVILDFDDSANAGAGVKHPFIKGAFLKTTDFGVAGRFQTGDQMLAVELPFGSFTPEQPVAPLAVTFTTSNLADLGTAFPFTARADFIYGADSLNNPLTDPPITGPLANDSTVPTLLTVTKVYVGPEDETATGPNFKRRYKLQMRIPDGVTLNDVVLSDILPNELQFTQVIDTRANGVSVTTTDLSTPSTTVPGGSLSRQFVSVTGAAGVDAEVEFESFVPRLDSATARVLAAATADDKILGNQAYGYVSWTPIDTRDSARRVADQATVDPVLDNPANPVADVDAEHELEAQANAIQKTVAIVTDTAPAGLSPGDVLEYTLNVQISDYFAFQNLELTDEYSDAQRLDLTFAPTFTVTEHGTTTAAAFDALDFTLTDLTDGTPNNGLPLPAAMEGGQRILFRLSDALVRAGADAQLLGGGITDSFSEEYNNPLTAPGAVPFGATTGTIKFRVVVQDSFRENFPAGDAVVNSRDTLGNQCVISGDVLEVTQAAGYLTATGSSESDGTATSLVIAVGNLTKTIYAVNGSTSFSSPVNLHPADTITYRITYTLPNGDVESLVLRDYLPLPALKAGDPDANGVAGPTWVFNDVVSADVPGVGQAKFGPTDTFRALSSIVPVVTVSAANGNNTLLFTYGSHSNPANSAQRVDLLFTVAVAADPFADGLFLTN